MRPAPPKQDAVFAGRRRARDAIGCRLQAALGWNGLLTVGTHIASSRRTIKRSAAARPWDIAVVGLEDAGCSL